MRLLPQLRCPESQSEKVVKVSISRAEYFWFIPQSFTASNAPRQLAHEIGGLSVSLDMLYILDCEGFFNYSYVTLTSETLSLVTILEAD
jgi:hypothetical protein